MPARLQIHQFDYKAVQDFTNEEWMSLKVDAEGKPRILTGQGIIIWNNKNQQCSSKPIFVWRPLAVESYNSKTELFTVRWLSSPNDVNQLHRVQICFDCENPKLYIKRFVKALKARSRAFVRIVYYHLIDNLPLEDLAEMEPMMHRNIENKIKATKQMREIDITKIMMEVDFHFKYVYNVVLFNQYIYEQ